MSLESQRVKQLKQQLKLDKLANDMKGEGMFVFENNTKGDLFLPRQTSSGRRLVRKGEQFIGDSYYFGLLRTNELKLIREIESQPQTLLTEQPPIVTYDGTIEHVTHKDVLLTEAPLDGVKVLK